jgi:uncharacterized membrane protein
VNSPNTTPITMVEPKASLVTIVNIVYALHAVGLGIGAFTSSMVVTSFLFYPLSIVGLVLNYAMRDEARGTWIGSHFEWQIQTFWRVLAWAVAISVVSAPLILLFGLGFLTLHVGLFALGIRAMIRIARGWLRLRGHEPMPAT